MFGLLTGSQVARFALPAPEPPAGTPSASSAPALTPSAAVQPQKAESLQPTSSDVPSTAAESVSKGAPKQPAEHADDQQAPQAAPLNAQLQAGYSASVDTWAPHTPASWAASVEQLPGDQTASADSSPASEQHAPVQAPSAAVISSLAGQSQTSPAEPSYSEPQGAAPEAAMAAAKQAPMADSKPVQALQAAASHAASAPLRSEVESTAALEHAGGLAPRSGVAAEPNPAPEQPPQSSHGGATGDDQPASKPEAYPQQNGNLGEPGKQQSKPDSEADSQLQEAEDVSTAAEKVPVLQAPSTMHIDVRRTRCDVPERAHTTGAQQELLHAALQGTSVVQADSAASAASEGGELAPSAATAEHVGAQSGAQPDAAQAVGAMEKTGGGATDNGHAQLLSSTAPFAEEDASSMQQASNAAPAGAPEQSTQPRSSASSATPVMSAQSSASGPLPAPAAASKPPVSTLEPPKSTTTPLKCAQTGKAELAKGAGSGAQPAALPSAEPSSVSLASERASKAEPEASKHPISREGTASSGASRAPASVGRSSSGAVDSLQAPLGDRKPSAAAPSLGVSRLPPSGSQLPMQGPSVGILAGMQNDFCMEA